MGRPKKPEKEKHIVRALQGARYRAKRDNVVYNLTKEYLLSITPDRCPIFNTPFIWGESGMGVGRTREDAPTLDRIIPELGYVEGNVAFISYRANRIKDNGTMEEHYAIADWIWNQTHAKEKSTTPVPAGSYIPGAVGAELGSVSTPWTWEDSDDINDYRGTTEGENSYRSAKEGSGVSMGHGGQEVGAFDVFDYIESSGALETAPRRLREAFERLRSQFREPSLAAGTASEIRQFGD